MQQRIEEFIERGRIIESASLAEKQPRGFAMPSTVHGPEFEKWKSELYLFVERNFKQHVLYSQLIEEINGFKSGWVFTLDRLVGILHTVAEDPNIEDLKKELEVSVMTQSKSVFIVHGHDDGSIAKIERFVFKMGLTPIKLSDQASEGKTIIEKLEAHTNTNVGFGIILYTPCDTTLERKKRARQNVVLEHGYLMGKLGRSKVCALVNGDVELPSDIGGVVYIDMGRENWELALVKELQAAKYNVDANKI